MKKLINWLIKKLGGYTEEEYNDVMTELRESTAKVSNLRENADYWFDKFMAEYRAYLALLNAHNASAEAAQKMLAPIEMAKALKAYCAERDDCEGCELHNTEHCKLSYKACPEYWEVE